MRSSPRQAPHGRIGDRSRNDWYQSQTAGQFAVRAQQILRDEYNDSPLFVLKDPRICRLVPFWFAALKALEVEPRTIIPIRSPLEVAYSIRSEHGHPISYGLLIWLRHVLDAERHTRSAFALFRSLERISERSAISDA